MGVNFLYLEFSGQIFKFMKLQGGLVKFLLDIIIKIHYCPKVLYPSSHLSRNYLFSAVLYRFAHKTNL